MIGRQIIVYFIVFIITNFIAIFFSSKILDSIYAKFFKLLLFSAFFTIIQLVLEHFNMEIKKGNNKEWEKLGIARYVTWPRTKCSILGVDINNKS